LTISELSGIKTAINPTNHMIGGTPHPPGLGNSHVMFLAMAVGSSTFATPLPHSGQTIPA